MEAQRNVSVYANGEVVVHYIKRQFGLGPFGILHEDGHTRIARYFEVPTIQLHHFAVLNVAENLGDRLVRVAASPVDGPRQIVTCAQWENGNGRCRLNSNLVYGGEHPASGAIAATGENPQIVHFLVEIKAQPRASLREIKHLSWIEMALKLLHQLGALVATAFWIDEHQQRLEICCWNGLDGETTVHIVEKVRGGAWVRVSKLAILALRREKTRGETRSRDGGVTMSPHGPPRSANVARIGKI